MDLKERPNHERYLRVLAGMTFEQRLMKAFELSAWAKDDLRRELLEQFPDSTKEELHRLFLARRFEGCAIGPASPA